MSKSPGVPSESQGGFARKLVEISKQEGEGWLPLWGATTDSYQALEEISCDVVAAGTFYDAVGVRIQDLPITAEKVLAALKSK